MEAGSQMYPLGIARETLLALVITTGLLGAALYLLGPTLVAVAVIGLAVIAVALAKPDWATLIVLFVLYANLAVVAFRRHDVPEVLASSAFVLLGVPLLKYVVLERKPVLFDRVLLLMAVYLAVLLVSAMLSEDPSNSFDRFIQYTLQGMVLYWLILNTVRTRIVLRRALFALLMAGVLMGAISMYQQATHSFGNSYGGMAQMQDVEFVTDEGSRDPVSARMAGPIGDSNRYAQIMVVLLPIGLGLFFARDVRRTRLLVALAAVPIAAAVLLTYSRGAGVALAFFILAIVVLRYVSFGKLVAACAVGGLVIALLMPAYVDRFAGLLNLTQLGKPRPAGVDSSVRTRATLALATLRIFAAHPVVGVGPGQAHLYVAQYAKETGFIRVAGTKRSHDLYLEELANTGVLGFAAFLAIVGAIVRQLWVARHNCFPRDAEYGHLVTGVLLAILVYLVTALFLQLSYERYFWILLALGGVAVRLSRLKVPTASSLPTETR